MPRSGLTSRLKQLRTLRKSAAPEIQGAPEALRNLEIPGFKKMGEYTFYRRELLTGIHPPKTFSNMLLPAGLEAEELLFFDLETSGLSSGAGTVAFLAGFGCYLNEGFLLEQYFLSDYPGEAEFLAILHKRLKNGPYFVSYNGRSFDASLLKTRAVLQGLTFNFSRHLDLLYVSRRLWRNAIGSCSLGNIEQKVLGVERDGDLPGREVPDRWFNFLRCSDSLLLKEIFTHHRQDILSLEVLWKGLEALFQNPYSHDNFGSADPRALGIYLLSSGDPRGEDLLRRAWERGDFKAGRLLALSFKRSGNIDAALDLWLRMASGNDPGVYEELAKYYEHRAGDYTEALRWARLGLGAAARGAAGNSRIGEFNRRISRLERKINAQV